MDQDARRPDDTDRSAVTSVGVPPLEVEVDAFMKATPLDVESASLEERIARMRAFQRALHEAGLAVVAWPREYGGRGLSIADAAVVARRLGDLHAPEIVNYVGIEVLAPALLEYSSPAQLTEWLPTMASAEVLWCQLFSEPDAGSDLASLRTRAVAEGEGWRITGTKLWSTWGQFADRGLLLARTGSVQERHRTISAFVIDMTERGVTSRALRAMTGEEEFAEVTFDGAWVGPGGLVGRIDDGWSVAMRVLTAERGPYAVHRSSVLRALLADVIDNAKKLGATHVQRQSLARAFSLVRLLDLQIDQVLDRLRSGTYPGPEAALTKRLLAQAEQALFDIAFDLQGPAGAGWTEKMPPWTLGYLYSQAASIYGGTQEIQRNIIGERLLGLPR